MSGLGGRLAALSRDLLVRRDGPLTRELLQRPGQFGLGLMPEKLAHDQTTNMVCGFCSTGCGLTLLLKQGQATGLLPSAHYPVNIGMACPKGWEALAPLRGPGRATTPLLRRGGKLAPCSWEQAVFAMTERFKAIQERHGPESIAWLGTGQLPTEELAWLGALAKFGMGIVHGDGNTRQCMATAATAYKQAFGFDAPPLSYQDFEQSDVIVLIGSNLCIAHPILWERICKNPHDPCIIVVDPRRTETAMAATQHYAIAPKSDLVLLYAVARELIANGWIDRDYVAAHTADFDAFSEHVQAYTLERAAEATGIPGAGIAQLARRIHEGKRVSFWWTMGVNQSHEGTRTAQAIIALALMTGNIGRPGTGPNSITGQCNAMGSRLFSNTTNLFGGRDFGDAEQRQEVASILGIDAARIPAEPSLAYDQILEGVLSGKIKALWIIATNPAHSWINQGYLHDVLGRLECLVVQDMYADTETALLADILLPAAGWGEKEGTFINSERRIGLIKRVCRAPGQALADFFIFQLVAEAWGCADLFRSWTHPEAVFQTLKQLSRGRPCDFSGIEDYAEIDRHNGIQWPFPAGATLVDHERRLFEDGRYFTPDGRARFFYAEPRPLPEPVSPNYPLLLLTGRGSSTQWHTQTRTKRSPVLDRMSPSEAYVEMSPQDARKYGISPDQQVTVSSQRGSMRARAFLTHAVKPGEVFIPMHDASMNQLTFAAFDPFSRQPAYKACAVRVDPANVVSDVVTG
ncbi:MAG TPA: nitrate reductase [Polyangiaceae bacterium]|nr:nitrate reductase [Polyangiaceae bacterium]